MDAVEETEELQESLGEGSGKPIHYLAVWKLGLGVVLWRWLAMLVHVELGSGGQAFCQDRAALLAWA